MSILLNDGAALLWNDLAPITLNPPQAAMVVTRCSGGGHATFVATYPEGQENFSVNYDDILAPSPSAESTAPLTVRQTAMFFDARRAVSEAGVSAWQDVKAAIEGKSYSVLEGD